MIKNLILAMLVVLPCYSQSTNVVTVSVQWSTNNVDWNAPTNALRLTNQFSDNSGFYQASALDLGPTNSLEAFQVTTSYGTNVAQTFSPFSTNLLSVYPNDFDGIGNIIPPGAVYQFFNSYSVRGEVVPGQSYKVTFGTNDVYFINASVTITNLGPGQSTNFVAAPVGYFVGLSALTGKLVTAQITPLLFHRPWLDITNITPPIPLLDYTNDVTNTNTPPSP